MANFNMITVDTSPANFATIPPEEVTTTAWWNFKYKLSISNKGHILTAASYSTYSTSSNMFSSVAVNQLAGLNNESLTKVITQDDFPNPDATKIVQNTYGQSCSISHDGKTIALGVNGYNSKTQGIFDILTTQDNWETWEHIYLIEYNSARRIGFGRSSVIDPSPIPQYVVIISDDSVSFNYGKDYNTRRYISVNIPDDTSDYKRVEASSSGEYILIVSFDRNVAVCKVNKNYPYDSQRINMQRHGYKTHRMEYGTVTNNGLVLDRRYLNSSQMVIYSFDPLSGNIVDLATVPKLSYSTPFSCHTVGNSEVLYYVASESENAVRLLTTTDGWASVTQRTITIPLPGSEVVQQVKYFNDTSIAVEILTYNLRPVDTRVIIVPI